MKARILSILLAATFLLQLPNLYRNPTFLEDNFGVPTKLVLIIALAIFAVLRVTARARLTSQFVRILKAISLVVFPLTAEAIVLNGLTNANLIYGFTRINLTNLLFLCVGILVTFGINLTNEQWKKNGYKLITFIPLIALFILNLVNLLPFDQLAQITRQDGPAEYFQNVFLLGSLFIAILALIKSFKQRNKLVIGFLIASVAGLTFLLGEEISWGQFIFGIETPAHWASINEQQETTLHNLKGIAGNISYLYFLLGLVVCLAPLTEKFVKKVIGSVATKVVLPSRNLVFYFSIVAGYYFYNIVNPSNNLNYWPEAIELFLYGGIFVYFIQIALQLKAFQLVTAYQTKFKATLKKELANFLTIFTSRKFILR